MGRMSCLLRKQNKILSSSPRNNSTRGSGSLCRHCSRNSSISPNSTRLHSSQHHPGADGMQHHKHVVQPRPHAAGAATHEGRGEGTRDGPGCMGGVEASGEALLSKLSLVIPGKSGKGATSWIGWKRRLLPVSISFEIDAKERCYKTLLTARNLMAVVRESQEYVVNILPRKCQRSSSEKEEAGEEWEGVKEPTLPRICPPPITHEAEVIIEEPVNPAPHSISSGSGHVAGLNHSSTSLAAVARLANLAEEAASINIRTPLIRMSMQLKPFVRPRWRKRGRKPESASDDPDRLALVLVKGPPSRGLARRAI
ncbi:hypothetical protein CK203_033227 [Vitis vinifera]|uniref:Uncharacterized protein n=1 Tax=Vitis vinifera TaxID=29760 RepID=A0A438HBU0_VITVI|nr:hypothetical protein CK203_033227 [Vitis vinifera]